MSPEELAVAAAVAHTQEYDSEVRCTKERHEGPSQWLSYQCTRTRILLDQSASLAWHVRAVECVEQVASCSSSSTYTDMRYPHKQATV